jgi:hypothetical protein
MALVVHGTVQVQQRAGKPSRIFITPTADYKVRHDGKDYLIFVEEKTPPKTPSKSYIFCLNYSFEVDPSLTDTLRQAAVVATKIQIEIEDIEIDATAPAKVVGLRIPAPAQST